MSPVRIIPGMFENDESPSAQWNKRREEYRTANQQRVQRSLSDYKVPIIADIPIFGFNEQGKFGICGYLYRVIVGYATTPFQVNNEKHGMDDPAPGPFIPARESVHLEQAMARHARNTLDHMSMEVPEDSDLAHEDLDGPPINDLSDEDEIFRAMDEMKKRGQEGTEQ